VAHLTVLYAKRQTSKAALPDDARGGVAASNASQAAQGAQDAQEKGALISNRIQRCVVWNTTLFVKCIIPLFGERVEAPIY